MPSSLGGGLIVVVEQAGRWVEDMQMDDILVVYKNFKICQLQF